MTQTVPPRVLVLSSFACLALTAAASGQSTTRVSVSSDGLPGNDVSAFSHISDDGQFVVFTTNADNLIPMGLSGQLQVYRHDRIAGTTALISATASGTPGNNQSHTNTPARVQTADGRWVVFASLASNLVPNDSNTSTDAFLRDCSLGVTTLVSTAANGQQGNGHSQLPAITPDGRFVVFESGATNLVPLDLNGKRDVFVKDLTNGTVELASLSSINNFPNGDSGSACISGDGRWVAYASDATNIVQNDSNGARDVFARDRVNGITQRVSMSSSGLAANGASDTPAISTDGVRVLFQSSATNLVANDTNAFMDAFVRDLVLGTTVRVSVSSNGIEGNSGSFPSSISARGRYVAFYSSASNLFPGDTNGQADAFRHDMSTGTLEMLSISSTGALANDYSEAPSLSADGSIVAFASVAANLIAGDANFARDVFVRDLNSSATPITSYCTAKTSSGGCVSSIGTSGVASISSSDSFRLCVGNLPPFANGLFIWSQTAGAQPFHGGTLCVAPPIVRSPVSNAGVNQTASLSCNGATAFPMGAVYLASHGLVAGNSGYAQFWFRDSGFPAPDDMALTDAATFVVEP